MCLIKNHNFHISPLSLEISQRVSPRLDTLYIGESKLLNILLLTPPHSKSLPAPANRYSSGTKTPFAATCNRIVLALLSCSGRFYKYNHTALWKRIFEFSARLLRLQWWDTSKARLFCVFAVVAGTRIMITKHDNCRHGLYLSVYIPTRGAEGMWDNGRPRAHHFATAALAGCTYKYTRTLGTRGICIILYS